MHERKYSIQESKFLPDEEFYLYSEYGGKYPQIIAIKYDKLDLVISLLQKKRLELKDISQRSLF